MIALIDYGSGNLRSVRKALEFVGADVALVTGPDGWAEWQAVVLPGVGHFGDCVANLHARGLWEPLAAWLAAGRPFLGICVGYQMLFDGSEEAPAARGFGFFRGTVRRFTECGLKIPQIGWNALALAAPDHWLFAGLPDRPFVYFVHSYYPAAADPATVTAYAEYGDRFPASAARGPVVGVQFHPEKSQAVGLTMLTNFVRHVRAAA